MKNYKEMADNVFSRIVEEKKMEIKKRHNRVYMASAMAVFGLVLLIGVGVWLNGKITLGEPGPNPDSETGTQIEQSVEKVKKTIYKDIVFSNDLRGEFGANESIPEHIIDIEKYIADEEALYACYVVQSEGTFEVEPLEREEGETDASYDVREQMHRAEAMAECFMDKGLMVMPSYPYCMYNNEDVFSIRGDKASFDNKCILGECLVVGTYEQLMEVFDNSEPINGAFFCVANAPRPDIFDQILGTVPEILVSDIQAVENEIIIRYADELPEFLGSDYCEFTVDLETYENATVENDYTIIYKDISFRNYYRAQFVDDVVLSKNTIWSYFSEEDDKNALYAFCVYGGGNVYVEKQRENETQSEYQIRYQQAMSQSAASKALEMGLMVLPEYKYCGTVFST